MSTHVNQLRPSEFVSDYPRSAAAWRPGKLALAFDGQLLSFSELEARVAHLHSALRQSGVGHGDRIGYIGHNNALVFEVMFATMRARAVFTPVNWRLSPSEMAAIVRDAAPALVFAEREYVEALGPALSLLGTQRLCVIDDPDRGFEEWRSSFSLLPFEESPQREDVILQLYTSGTTGAPKGVLLTNRNMKIQRDSETATSPDVAWLPEDVTIASAPMFNIGGVNWALMALSRGTSCVVLQVFRPLELLSTLQEYRVNHLFAIPSMIRSLCDLQKERQFDTSSLRLLHYGSAPMSVEILQKAMETFDCGFVQHYGMTEGCGSKFILPPGRHSPNNPQLLETCGSAMPGVEARIVDDGGTTLARGEVGELWLKSDAFAVGYFRAGRAEPLPLTHGWYATGDVGRMDEEGFLTIVDRKNDMVVSGGTNVYPAEIERVLSVHPMIVECAVIGVPDDSWGEAVKAIVVVRPGDHIEADAILTYLRTRLAAYKVPKSVEFRDSLPRSPIGKIEKKLLREPYWRGRARRVN
jgi:long-chain acyl-CoA synthetase